MPRVKRRTARKKLQAAGQRLKAWIQQHRHRPGREVFQRLNARLRGHYNDYGVRGNTRSLSRFFTWAMDWTCTGLNRRGGTRQSVTWEQLTQVLDRVKIARPRITALGCSNTRMKTALGWAPLYAMYRADPPS
jgi:RNA-directed DNA polymerase